MLDIEYPVINLSSIDMEQLQQVKGWQQKYKLLLRWGKLIPNDMTLQTDANKLNACEANTWVECSRYQENDQARLKIRFDSESSVVKGLAVLVLYHCNDRLISDVDNFDLETLMTDLQLTSHLSPSRVNGFLSFWQTVKLFCGNNY